jgi:hypothetical protein
MKVIDVDGETYVIMSWGEEHSLGHATLPDDCYTEDPMDYMPHAYVGFEVWRLGPTSAPLTKRRLECLRERQEPWDDGPWEGRFRVEGARELG